VEAKMNVLFKTASASFGAELNDSPAAKVIGQHLPLTAEVNTWGDEIYFNIGITCPRDGQTVNVKVGDVGYWPAGQCLCVFFGPTPVSSGPDPVPASAVVIVGKTDASVKLLKGIRDGERITVAHDR
jgi:hypothetical protein